MVATDEEALICDFAETYHIYDWRSLPATYAAVLAKGLRPESRIKMALNKEKLSTTQMLQAIIADGIRTLVWHNTEDGHKGENPPESIVSLLLGLNNPAAVPGIGFDTPEDFLLWRQQMIGGGASGG